MTEPTDITNLRKLADDMHVRAVLAYCAMHAAADEIERLRAVEGGGISNLAEVHDRFDPETGVLTVDVLTTSGLAACGFDLYPDGRLAWAIADGSKNGVIRAAPALTISDHAKAILSGADDADLDRAAKAALPEWSLRNATHEIGRFQIATAFLHALADAASPAPDPEPLRIEVGGLYRTRGGAKAMVTLRDSHQLYPFDGAIVGHGESSWTATGCFESNCDEHKHDLVAPWSDDA